MSEMLNNSSVVEKKLNNLRRQKFIKKNVHLIKHLALLSKINATI